MLSLELQKEEQLSLGKRNFLPMSALNTMWKSADKNPGFNMRNFQFLQPPLMI